MLTPGSDDEPAAAAAAQAELARRLGRFRHELHQLGNPPARADLERLLALAKEFELRDEVIREELAEIGAAFDALELAERMAAGNVPVVLSLGLLPPGEQCHFITPVRFGRRHTDQVGHLELTSGWLKFHGALDLSVVWTEVADVQRAGRDIVVRLADSRRLLRFHCHAIGEAARGAVITAHLARSARAGDPTPSPRQATV